MIAGALVVSTDCVSGPREILAPDTNFDEILMAGWEITPNGILVAVDDKDAVVEALEWVMDNPERVGIMKCDARERAYEWDISNIAHQYEALLFPKDTE
jgi:N-acetylgalactosamine-N,N'-diacetylbacillosaminyl-diphospho-undecaprenol 4-alpha-N-acetylgalactosaminyltransferase